MPSWGVTKNDSHWEQMLKESVGIHARDSLYVDDDDDDESLFESQE